MTPEKRKQRRQQALMVFWGVLVVAGLASLVYRLASSNTVMPKKTVPDVTQIQLVQPPPPPPPPPPPEQKMVEQAPIKEPEFKNDQPEEKPPEEKQADNSKPPSDPLALDAKGQGPADGFALGGRPGGATFGGGGTGGGSRYGWYAALLQGHVRDALQREKKLVRSRYNLGIKVWLGNEGQPQRVELMGSTGKPETDQILKDTVLSLSRLSELPPKDLPQPVVLKVSSS